ncbi:MULTISPECIES: ribbon-helix-helix domain-containing protein [unclassified Okeania]|uniref:Ribbon-helix-helix domain-containing protein n=1 Tax=Okeania hirsuta TaxID=1458930 RepID=A0A3N6RCQ1_9CYAN|nr:ribbon-helix-helix domain-containing protein [Okeania sp. SIO4D6]NEP40994.1 ribbon-helix-helix domain-containing protein [Okeania sp. SIO2H7]NEP73764.1 ribbon-helix-helix domain-containing protein [Okeania sp. SIO2G5]NEP94422.1 ribbon-helix-helix domain-containing protein [Okeania sp. SIO2F5]NEQ92290.1 ribbon-helix-helix domain-containing protein [Okeania sp. SIO2G4]NES76294.1 ribbon-helix-helix domain-containing protein [Okeania sp. SIO1H4]NES89057.1 ribbon-helix-helix domain-containing p
MPRKSIHQEKKASIHLTVTPTTKKRLKQISAALGISQSELIELWTKEAELRSQKQLLGEFLTA